MNWLAILTVYVGTGLCFMFLTMARLEIILAVRQSVGHKSPWWFKALAWGLIAGTSILLWPVLLKGWFAKARSIRGIFPGGDGYQMLEQRLRMIDAVRRETDGYLSIESCLNRRTDADLAAPRPCGAGGQRWLPLHARLRGPPEPKAQPISTPLNQPNVGQTPKIAPAPDHDWCDEKTEMKGWLREQTTVEAAEIEHLVKDDRLGPNPVPFGFERGAWINIRKQIRPGDQLWKFCSSGESWERLSGREGLCIVRDGEIVASIVTCMN